MIRSRVVKGEQGERDFYFFIFELGTEGSLRKGELWWEADILIVAGEVQRRLRTRERWARMV